MNYKGVDEKKEYIYPRGWLQNTEIYAVIHQKTVDIFDYNTKVLTECRDRRNWILTNIVSIFYVGSIYMVYPPQYSD